MYIIKVTIDNESPSMLELKTREEALEHFEAYKKFIPMMTGKKVRVDLLKDGKVLKSFRY